MAAKSASDEGQPRRAYQLAARSAPRRPRPRRGPPHSGLRQKRQRLATARVGKSRPATTAGSTRGRAGGRGILEPGNAAFPYRFERPARAQRGRRATRKPAHLVAADFLRLLEHVPRPWQPALPAATSRSRRERPKMQVVLFKTRPEYEAHMAITRPKAATHAGLYDDQQRVAFFFGGDTSVYPTWYHEATHQLFRESALGTRDELGQAQLLGPRRRGVLHGIADAARRLLDRRRLRSGPSATRSLSRPVGRPLAASRPVSLPSSATKSKTATTSAGYTRKPPDWPTSSWTRRRQISEPFIDLVTAIYHGEDTADTFATAHRPAARPARRRVPQVPECHRRATCPASLSRRQQSLCLDRTAVTDAGLTR